MRRCFALAVALITGFLLVVPLEAADDDDAPKYPEVGSNIPGPFHVLNITGKRKGRYHCLVCRNGLNPTAAIFVRPDSNDDMKIGDWLKSLDADAPLGKLYKQLDEMIDTHTDAGLSAFAVYLAKKDEELPLQTRLEKMEEGKELQHVVQALADDLGQESMKDWNVKADAEVTVIIYNQHKVIGYWTFAREKMTDKDVATILAAFDKQILPKLRAGPKPQLKLKPKDKEEPKEKEPKEKDKEPKEKDKDKDKEKDKDA